MDSGRTIDELIFRRKLCEGFIRFIETMDDPRKGEAIAEYQRQLQSINEQIAAIQPPPVVVGLKTAALFGKTK